MLDQNRKHLKRSENVTVVVQSQPRQIHSVTGNVEYKDQVLSHQNDVTDLDVGVAGSDPNKNEYSRIESSHQDVHQYNDEIDGSIIYDDSMLDDYIDTRRYDNMTHSSNDNSFLMEIHPGAIQVDGSGALASQRRIGNHDNNRRSRVEHALLETPSGLHVQEDGQAIIGSFTLEVDGFVPSRIEPIYLVPDENVQRLEHLYASNPLTSHRNTSRQPSSSMKRFLKKFWLAIIFIAALIAAIITLTARHTDELTPNSQAPELKYKSFETKDELVAAVDAYLSGQNSTPSLEETYGNISNWNVSQIEDFSTLFAISRNSLNRMFNADISRWDVSAATNMSSMFHGAAKFKGDISTWNVSHATDMSWFMSEVTYFNANLSQWDTSSLENATAMFNWANSFTGIGLERWNVGKVRYMRGMFKACNNFNGNVSTWDVSNVVTMSQMFADAYRFDGDLSTWDMANVRDTSYMFYKASSFHGAGVENWNTSMITTMHYMFYSATSFDSNLSLWNLSAVEDTSAMFFEASSFQGVGVETWDTSKIKIMNAMFNFATSFDANLSFWDLSNTKDTSFMFSEAHSFQGIGLEHWNTSKVENMKAMFELATIFDGNLSAWDLSNVNDTSAMFGWAPLFKGVGVETWDTSNIHIMMAMFYSAASFDANLSSWDLSNVKDTSFMFWGTSSFRGVGTENWDTSKIENMADMFEQAISFNANLSLWDVGSVVDISYLFWNASSLQGIGLDSWITSSVNSMFATFGHATSFNSNLSNWDVSKVTNMDAMFLYATSFLGDGLEFWNVSVVNTTYKMFESATSFNCNLSNWDVSSISNATDMFKNATSFEGVVWWNDTSDTLITI